MKRIELSNMVKYTETSQQVQLNNLHRFNYVITIQKLVQISKINGPFQEREEFNQH